MSIIQEKSQKIHSKSLRHFIWQDAIFLLLIAIFIISGITLVPFHGDEATYISMSKDYDVLVKDRNWGALRIDAFTNTENFNQRTRLSIGSILGLSIGFARDITGMNENVNSRWLWNSSWSWNVQQGSIPSPELLKLARFCSALMGSLSIMFLFLIAGHLLGSRFSAWIVVILFATQGDILMNFRRAMQEGPKFLFLLVTLLSAAYILKELEQGKARRRLYVFMGIASGLTLAAKQDTAPMLMAIYLSLALIPWLQKRTRLDILANILYLGAAGILAYASFLISMPIFWGWWETSLALVGLSILLLQIPFWNFDKRAKPFALVASLLIIIMTIISPSQWLKLPIPIFKMVETRKLILGVQPNDNLFKPNVAKNKAKFFAKTIFTSNVMYIEDTRYDLAPIYEQIKIYEASRIHGRIGAPIWDIPIIIMFFIGVCWLLIKFTSEKIFILMLFFIPAVFLSLFIPLLWQRYYLIMQIPYTLIAGAGAGNILNWGKQFLKQSLG